ncbi:MAG: hypothetical protein Q9201_007106, partial [Fulgogasparrea decipioides]
MGAVVIAMGRNQDSLKRLQQHFSSTGRLITVPMTGTFEGDVAALRDASSSSSISGSFSAFLDLSPPAAADNTYFQAIISLLKYGGRVALMGGMKDGASIP